MGPGPRHRAPSTEQPCSPSLSGPPSQGSANVNISNPTLRVPPTVNGAPLPDEVERLVARQQHSILVRLAEAAANGKVHEALAQADRLRGTVDELRRHHAASARDRRIEALQGAEAVTWQERPGAVAEAAARLEAAG